MLKKLVSILSSLTILLTMNLQACDAVQQMIQGTPTPTPTPTFTPTNTPTVTPTITLTPTKTPTPTITPNLTATQEYETFYSFLKQIFDAGQIPSISPVTSTYKKLDDFSYQYAAEYGWVYFDTGITAKNFVIRADFTWSVADQKNYSGCGFLFREEEENSKFYLIALDALDGVLLSYRWDYYDYSIGGNRRSKLPDMGQTPYEATFALVVYDNKAYTYINDNFYSEYDLKKNFLTKSGRLSYLVLSGSDKDFGTRCEISNVQIWKINR